MIWLFAVAGLFLLLALHPFVTFPASLWLLHRFGYARYRPPGRLAHAATMSLCVCAYNEERVIRAKVENALALRRSLGTLQILFYVDAASDATADILRSFGDQIDLVVGTERRGKTWGMNTLIARATGEVVVFSDANVMLEEHALANLRRYFAAPEVGCVCGHLTYRVAAAVTASNGSLYWRLEERIKALEDRLGWVMGADGSIFAVRQALYREPPPDIIDDMYVSFRILCAGYRIVRAPDVRAFEDSVPSGREEFQRKVRIACQALNVHRLLWPQLRRLPLMALYIYLSHKLIRWFVAYWLATASLLFLLAVVASLGPLATAILAIGATGLGWAALRLGVRAVVQASDIMGAFLATGLGVYRSVRGDRFQTWTPATSIRQLAPACGRDPVSIPERSAG